MQHGYTSSEETGTSEVEKAAHENDKAKAEKLTSNLVLADSVLIALISI